MKIYNLLLIAIIIILTPCMLNAASYYVTQNGAGARNGTSAGNAWSTADFNGLSGDYSDDRFYFIGHFSGDIVVYNKHGLAGHNAVFDGLENDDCALNTDLSWNCSGRAVLDGASILCSDSAGAASYVEIRDFEVNNFLTSNAIHVFGYNNGIIPHDILINGNYIHDGTNKGIDISDQSYGNNRPYNITVEHNEVNNVGTDTAGMDINISFSRDIIARYNYLHADGTDINRGIDGIHGINSYNILTEYNFMTGHKYDSAAENAFDIKGSCHDWIVRYNYILDESDVEYPVIIQTADGHDTYNIYFYANRIENSSGGILIYPRGDETGNLDNIHVFSNVIVGNAGSGVYPYTNSTRDIVNLYVYNNTIANNGSVANTGIRRYNVDIGNAVFRNNIIFNNNGTNNRQINFDNAANISFSDNLGFDSDGTAIIIWGGLDYNFDSNVIGTNNAIDNPLLSSSLSLENNSPAIDNGYNLSKLIASIRIQGSDYNIDYQEALMPTSDWGVFPPNVQTVDQLNYNSFEQGAYVYTGGASNTAPIVNAGIDHIITLPVNTVNLDGTVTDDGLPDPPGAVTTTWTKQSGPGTVTFGNASAVDTTASFSTAGTYVLRLTADDTDLQISDDVTVTVNVDISPPAAPTGLLFIL